MVIPIRATAEPTAQCVLCGAIRPVLDLCYFVKTSAYACDEHFMVGDEVSCNQPDPKAHVTFTVET
jgi:hypothetical protein